MEESIRVLHVDDEPDFAEMAATFVEREAESLHVETAHSAEEGLDRLAEAEYDCIVSDYEMPYTDGVEFLAAVREEYPERPFILYTGKGSEEVASDAISAGATDYLQKESGTDQYAVLANRIQNVVEQHRNRQRRTTLERIRLLVNDVNQALIRASSEREVDTRVCEILADAEPYAFAVIAEVNSETKRIEPRTWAGTGKGFLDEFEMSVAEGAPGRDAPGGRAYHDREIAVVQNIRTDPSYEHWRELALAHDFRSLAVVPLEYAESRFGLLALFADRPNAFDATEKQVLDELADDIAHAMHAQKVTSELEEKNRQLAEYREYNERIINAIDDIFFVHDETGSLQQWNDALVEVTGYSDDEIASMTGADFVPDEHEARTAEAIERVFERGHARLEAPLVTKEGETIPYEYAADRVDHPDGSPRLVGIGRDISERRERERELRRQNERLGEFASIVSHDLRNPLNVAQGELALAREREDGEHLANVASALERMDALIDDILTITREGGQVEATDAVDLAAIAERSWGSVATGDATLAIDATATIRADENRLRQLLENLFRNAIEHGDESVTVTVGDRHAENGFYVSDDGPGLPEDDPERAFEAGYSTSEDGTGFGLVIVKEIVEAHDWTIRAAESAAGGARFEITGVTIEA